MNALSAADAGLPQGTANAIFSSDNPQDQRKDNIRIDYRLNNNNQITYRYSKYNWIAVDAFRGTFPFARTDWDRPNGTQNVNWTSTISPTLINEFELLTLARSGVHQRLHRERSSQAQPHRDQLPVHLPAEQGDRGQDSDGEHRYLHRHRRRSVSLILAGPDPPGVGCDDLGDRPPHIQGRRRDRVLGRGRLRPDQRQRHSGRHQQPERAVRRSATVRGRRHRRRHCQYGARPVQRLRRARPARVHEVAGAGDRRVRPGFVEAAQQPDRGRRRPLGALAALVFDRPTTSPTSIRASTTRRPQRSSIPRPGVWSAAIATTASSCRATDSSATRTSWWSRRIRAVQALFRGEPRGFSETHYNVFEPRLGVSYSLNKKTIVAGQHRASSTTASP